MWSVNTDRKYNYEVLNSGWGNINQLFVNDLTDRTISIGSNVIYVQVKSRNYRAGCLDLDCFGK